MALSTTAILYKWLSKLKAVFLDQKGRKKCQDMNSLCNEQLKLGNVHQREQKRKWCHW